MAYPAGLICLTGVAAGACHPRWTLVAGFAPHLKAIASGTCASTGQPCCSSITSTSALENRHLGGTIAAFKQGAAVLGDAASASGVGGGPTALALAGLSPVDCNAATVRAAGEAAVEGALELSCACDIEGEGTVPLPVILVGLVCKIVEACGAAHEGDNKLRESYCERGIVLGSGHIEACWHCACVVGTLHCLQVRTPCLAGVAEDVSGEDIGNGLEVGAATNRRSWLALKGQI